MAEFRLHPGSDGVFYLAGELYLLPADRLVANVTERSDAEHDVVLDLTDLAFVDSTGIRAFLRIARAVTPRCLVLRRPQPNVATVLDIVGIHAFGIRLERELPNRGRRLRP